MAEFELLRPFWLLALVPLAYLLWRLSRVQKLKQDWSGIGDAHLVAELVDGKPSQGASALWWLALGWLLAVTVLAGPSWSSRPSQILLASKARVIVVDLSEAMQAQTGAQTEANAKVTLSQVQLLLSKLLVKPSAARTAIIVFAEYPYVVAPLTHDLNTLSPLISELSPAIMPVSGYRLDRALLLADELLTDNNISNGEVLLITAGTDSVSHAFTSASTLVQHQRHLNIISWQENTELEQLSQLTTGEIVLLSEHENEQQQQLQSILSATINGGGVSYISQNSSQQESGFFLLVLLLPIAALSFRRGWFGVILLPMLISTSIMLLPTNIAVAAPFDRAVSEQAQAFYLEGDYAQAQMLWRQLDTVNGKYNLANALVQLGRYQEALTVYQQVLKQAAAHQNALTNYKLVKAFLDEADDKSEDSSEDDNENSASTNDEADNSNDSDNDEQDKGSDQDRQNDSSNKESEIDQGAADNQRNRQQSGDNPTKQGIEESDLGRWLRKVPDEPSQFLKEKLLRQHQRRGYPELKAGQP